MQSQYNLRNPAVKRLMKEAQELREPTELYHAQPLEDNLFEWHFTFRGPEDSEFEGGIYHGRIILPPDYPMKPPSIIVLTANGRFETFKKICLSISGHHPESWQPSWSIRTAILAIIGFMPTHGNGAIGSLDYSCEERKVLSRRSNEFTCKDCGAISKILKPVTEASKSASKEAMELAKEISFEAEKNGKNKEEKSDESKPKEGGDSATPNPSTPVSDSAAASQVIPPQVPPQMPPFMPPGMFPQHPLVPGQPMMRPPPPFMFPPGPFWPPGNQAGQPLPNQQQFPGWGMFNPAMQEQFMARFQPPVPVSTPTPSSNAANQAPSFGADTTAPGQTPSNNSQGNIPDRPITNADNDSPLQPQPAPQTLTTPASTENAAAASQPAPESTSPGSTSVATPPGADSESSPSTTVTPSSSETTGLRQRTATEEVRARTEIRHQAPIIHEHRQAVDQSDSAYIYALMGVLLLAIAILIGRRIFMFNLQKMNFDI